MRWSRSAWGIPVDVAIFTNLTQDHLDFHVTMEAYFEAKAKLFHGVGSPPPRVAVINDDDWWGGERLVYDLAPESKLMVYAAVTDPESVAYHASQNTGG